MTERDENQSGSNRASNLDFLSPDPQPDSLWQRIRAEMRIPWRKKHPKKKFQVEIVLWLIAALWSFLWGSTITDSRQGTLLLVYASIGWIAPMFHLWQWRKLNRMEGADDT